MFEVPNTSLKFCIVSSFLRSFILRLITDLIDSGFDASSGFCLAKYAANAFGLMRPLARQLRTATSLCICSFTSCISSEAIFLCTCESCVFARFRAYIAYIRYVYHPIVV